MTTTSRRPMDKLRNDVNEEAWSRPDLIPFDIDWLVLMHHNGVLSRSDSAWTVELVKFKLDAGDDPMDLAAMCWCLAIRGNAAASPAFRALAQRAPEVLLACIDPDAARGAFSRWANSFASAAQSWRPPQEINMRIWNSKRDDQSIQDGTRGLYQKLATACADAALLGFPHILLREALAVASPAKPAASAPGFRAFDFILPAAATELGREHWKDSIAPLLSAHCHASAPSKFLEAVSLMAPRHDQLCSLAASALRVALLTRPALVRQAPSPTHERAFRSLGHAGNFALAASSKSPDLLRLFVGTLLGVEQTPADLGPALATFLRQCGAPRAQTSSLAAWAAHIQARDGLACSLPDDAVDGLWRGHLCGLSDDNGGAVFVSKLQTAAFSSRHLALAAYFARPSQEQESLLRLPPDQRSRVEAAVMSRQIQARDLADGSEEFRPAPAQARRL